ncbi:hypothetical protein QWM81_02025 [Streptomyces ficellus]|uniref:DUF3592 domain-containing protein n=1 Tax=Streptomyces ficellus TaxID=1977088 RepID=A0ABT7Z154_9ACTN|nr:hypothetical protein [Streptomyces ficellus]MDN3292841.1 hypothetical protein [Streptomyces ficellus]
MRAVFGLWRWRHNPLCRATDLAEAWVALVALLLICIAAPATGWVTGALTNASLQQSVRIQQEQRHPTTAQVLRRDDDDGEAVRGFEAVIDHRMRTSLPAQWTAPDGTRVTGSVPAARQAMEPGDTFRIWTDDRGRPVNRPMTEETAREHAVLAGIGTTLMAAGLVEGVRRLVVWRLVRRRYARLDQAWAQVGPDWGRTGAGS